MALLTRSRPFIQLNMSSILITMKKLGVKKQSRPDQQKSLKDFAEQMEIKVSENLKILLPFVAQNMGDWKAIGKSLAIG